MPNPDGEILARWNARLVNADCSPLEFYAEVETSLTECGLPDLRFSLITRREGGWFSPRRVYLRIRYRKLYFDVSAFVFGGALVIGWWLHEETSRMADLLAEIPGFGFLINKTTRAATYYTVDFIENLQRAVHETILRTVDRLSEQNGLGTLPDEARQPLREEIW